jgi:copper transport protein
LNSTTATVATPAAIHLEVKTRLFLLIALAALAWPAVAWGHASLVRTEPQAGAILDRAPAAVRVVFDDVVEVGPGVSAIRNDGGKTVLAGRAHVTGGRTLVIPLQRGLKNGAYSVRWSIVSDDGHIESGVLAFAVGAGSPAPTPELSAGSNEPQADSVVSRWFYFAGILGAAGIALFALVARPRDGERVAVVLSVSAVLAALGAAQEAHRIGIETRAGKAMLATFIASAVVASLAGAATLERRVLRPALLLALGLAAAPAFAGHALDPGLNRVNVVADILHVLGAAAWVGALVGLVLFRGVYQRRVIVLAAGGVVLLGATGIVRACFELVRVSQLWDTSYGDTLLVKTGVLLLALVVGWLLKARLRVRAGTELAIVAGLLVAVSILVLLKPGRTVDAAVLQRVAATEPGPKPPAPAPDAVVFAGQMGPLGTALQIEPRRTTAVVLSPAGGGLSGLEVRIGGTEASPCGSGCYRVPAGVSGVVPVEIDGFGPTLTRTFDVPRATPDADALLRRAAARYRALDGVTFLERIASSPSQAVTSMWRLERPNRISYTIPGGAQGVVIGAKRWDRSTPDGKWQASAQTPLRQPVPPWSEATNVHLVKETGETMTLTFVDPTTPAYFQATIDSKTLLPRVLHMTASAHFMVERYVRFNAEREIVPPR